MGLNANIFDADVFFNERQHLLLCKRNIQKIERFPGAAAFAAPK
jgi:hypothetical protein